jgi:hypothetical protein
MASRPTTDDISLLRYGHKAKWFALLFGMFERMLAGGVVEDREPGLAVVGNIDGRSRSRAGCCCWDRWSSAQRPVGGGRIAASRTERLAGYIGDADMEAQAAQSGGNNDGTIRVADFW